MEWDYLEGDGDFRSKEVTRLRDEADFIITNPPFSLFREFLSWLIAGGKIFSIIANKNCVTYKEVFPLIKDNKIWSGREEWTGGMWFKTAVNSDDFDDMIEGEKFKNVPAIWLTNMDHGRRHEPIPLMTMDDNIKFTKHKNDERWSNAYKKYDNYDAIEVPFADAIPSDYEGIMGVPITFLDKYCPEQFEILGCSYSYGRPEGWPSSIDMSVTIDGNSVYKRLLIRAENNSHREEK